MEKKQPELTGVCITDQKHLLYS